MRGKGKGCRFNRHPWRETGDVGGAPWFVAADVCRALDIANPTQAVARLDEDERSMFIIGRQGETNCVNEHGLYALVLGSRKPEAKAFKRWIEWITGHTWENENLKSQFGISENETETLGSDVMQK